MPRRGWRSSEDAPGEAQKLAEGICFAFETKFSISLCSNKTLTPSLTGRSLPSRMIFLTVHGEMPSRRAASTTPNRRSINEMSSCLRLRGATKHARRGYGEVVYHAAHSSLYLFDNREGPNLTSLRIFKVARERWRALLLGMGRKILKPREVGLTKGMTKEQFGRVSARLPVIPSTVKLLLSSQVKKNHPILAGKRYTSTRV